MPTSAIWACGTLPKVDITNLVVTEKDNHEWRRRGESTQNSWLEKIDRFCLKVCTRYWHGAILRFVSRVPRAMG